jgi:hypothetical protein
VLADRGGLRAGDSRRRDGDRLLYLFNLARCVVGLLLQVAHLARQRVEPLLLGSAGDDGGCRDRLVVMFRRRCRRFCPGIRIAQQSNHCDAGN